MVNSASSGITLTAFGLQLIPALFIAQIRELLCADLTHPRPAAEHAQTKRRTFFFGEDDQFDPRIRIGAEDLQRDDDPRDAVVVAAVGNRVDVRSAQPGGRLPWQA